LSLGDRDWYVENLWVLGVMMVAIYFCAGIAYYLRSYLTAQASENIALSVRDRLYDHLQRWSFEQHVSAETGDLIQRCTSDLETMRRFLSGQLIDATRTLLLMLLSLSVLLPINPMLTLSSICLMPFVFGFSAIFFRRIRGAFKEVDECEGELSTTIQESLTGVRVVRAFGRQHFELEKFAEKNRTFRSLVVKLLNINAAFWSTSDVFCALQIVLASGCAAYVAATGELSVGSFLIFMMYTRRMVWPVRHLGRIISDLGRVTVAIDRIGEILHSPQENYDEDKATPHLNGDICFEDVSFAYDGGKQVLDNISFTVPGGKTVAILGATGSGKSSMMLLLQRLYDVDSGAISIGGMDIREMSKKHLRQRVGIVLQEPFLYSRSIEENIGIAAPKPGSEFVHLAAQTAQAHKFITEFDKGYDTIVGERGVTLSGGQKQRVAIARTLMKDNDILIFDDSLSAVDTETDAAIRAELKEHRQGVTTFIISHRVTTLQEADFILVFEKGKITASGTHQELIATEGLYQRIYNIQTALETELEEVST
ncbi:MAG: ABC transporter ATP-binding protein/permease, partial [Symbiobacteriaceae bacterium]|nr:ABC transporter ATP-binding protein/permease [Symbiobacteriaceae bacterium]